MKEDSLLEELTGVAISFIVFIAVITTFINIL